MITNFFKSFWARTLLITLLAFCVAQPGKAQGQQIIEFKTTHFSCNTYNSRIGAWTGWTDWEASGMLMTIDLVRDRVTIYSPSIQIYRIYSYEGTWHDSDGDLVVEFKFYDQDNDRGTMRLLQRTSGVAEVYIYFSNVKWVYRVTRILP